MTKYQMSDLVVHPFQNLQPSIEPGWSVCVGSPYAPTLEEVQECRLPDMTLGELQELRAYVYTNGVRTHRLFLTANHKWVGGVDHPVRACDVPAEQVEFEDPIRI